MKRYQKVNGVFETIVILLFLSSAVFGQTFTVDDTGDAPDDIPGDGNCATAGAVCTLRAAIDEANALAGSQTIEFLAGLAGQAITIDTKLQITGPNSNNTIINGDIAPADGKPDIRIIAGQPGINGFHILNSANNEIRGFNLVQFTNGITDPFPAPTKIEGITSTGNIIASNYFGTDLNGGVIAFPGNYRAIRIEDEASNNRIGDATPTGINIISNTQVAGIQIAGTIPNPTNNNQITGNIIGLDATGTIDLGNGGNGIEVTNAVGTVIGSIGGGRNIISGNNGSGIYLDAASFTTVVDNYIGTDLTGTSDLGNADDGVTVDDLSDNSEIGDGSSGGGNLISGNNNQGIEIVSDNITVLGNKIGTRNAGTIAMPNTSYGIWIRNTAQFIDIGNNTIDGRNLISGNGSHGMLASGDDVTIKGNYIGVNTFGNGPIANSMGIFVTAGSNVLIGGTNPGDGNVVSGNTNGIQVNISAVGIYGNYVGTNSSGTASIANNIGIQLSTNAQGVIIGDGTPLGRNIISGNTQDGIAMDGPNVFGNNVIGNFIGTDLNGAAGVPNGGNGIFIEGDANNNDIDQNTIAFNSGSGIEVNGIAAPGTTNNTFSENSIFSNTTQGISIVFGAQSGILAPIITSTVNGLNNVTISGTSASGADIEIYADAADQGQIHLGSTTAVGTAWSTTINWDLVPTGLSNFTAIQLSAGSSSEFSIIEPASLPNPLIVTNTSNNFVVGSIRYAADYVNTNVGPFTITFDPSLVGQTITLTEDVEFTADNLTIEGDFDGSSDCIPDIIFSGDGITSCGGNDCNSFTILGTGNVISHLVFIRFDDFGGAAINIEGNNNSIEGCRLGIDLTDDITGNNNYYGVYVETGDNNVIGGTTACERNIISGNAAVGNIGVQISGTGVNPCLDNRVIGNYIGLDSNGSIDKGNWHGIQVGGNCTNTEIGGTVAGEGNVVAGNGNAEIRLSNTTSSGTKILGNLIGTDAAGTASFNTAFQGILVNNADGVQIGDGTPAGRNVIAGASWGIQLNVTADNNLVIGNYIGTDITGNLALPNTNAGIYILGGSTGNQIGDGTVGGRNIISGNNGSGINIVGPANTVLGNYIGVQANGSSSLANTNGVSISGANPGILIGDGTAAGRNVISGNTNVGIINLADDALIDNNLIGVAPDGITPMGNGSNGVDFNTLNGGYVNNSIMAHNGGYGIFVGATGGSQDHTFIQNSIYSNSSKGIELAAGANNNKTSPFITDYGTGTVSGTGIDGDVIHVYRDNSGSAGTLQGQEYIGTDIVALGTWSVVGPVVPSDLLNATATDGTGNTSEFSVNFGEILAYLGPDNTGTQLFDAQAGVVDIGVSAQGSDLDQVFTIENKSSAPLAINSVFVTGGSFIIQGAPAIVAPNSSENFTLRLLGGSLGLFSETLTIDSDDSDEALFTFTVAGEILVPWDVTFQNPAPNSIGVVPTSDIFLTFNDDGGAINSAFTVRSQLKGLVSGSEGFNDADFTFTPDNPFLAGDIITVTLGPGMESLQGIFLNKAITYQFTVASMDGPETPDFFQESVVSTLANGGISVFAVDMEGDGDIDILSASFLDNKVAWYENNGTQVFAERVITTSALGATNVYAADIEGDGDMDVFSASSSDDRIVWYENDGTQTFTPNTISAVADNARSVRVSDVDGDGDLDLLSSSINDDKIAWYENDGTQTFTPITVSLLADQPYSIIAADVDSDGDVDILSASYGDNKIAWHENDGSQSFTERIISTSALNAYNVYASDVDQDGDLDVLSASFGDDKIAWYENDGSESFTERIISSTAIGARTVYATDLDGDGDIDVASASSGDDKIAWYENDGTQVFTERIISTNADLAISVHVSDIDGDGDLDVLSGSYNDDKVAWYENTIANAPFITTWQTDNPGTSGASQITIPTTGAGYSYDIYWEEVGIPANNGTEPPGQTGDHTITFPSAGTYRVEITGNFPRIYFNFGGDRAKILTVEQWGGLQWSSMGSAFYGCGNLTVPATDAPDLSLVTDMSNMFNNAYVFNGIIDSWDVSNITNMSYLFGDTYAFNQNLDSWDVGNVTNMSGLLYNSFIFDGAIGSWDVSNVTDMNNMFYQADAFNQDIGSWNVSNVTNMSSMFERAASFNSNIGTWDVSSVINMSFMFRLADLFNQDIGSWNVINVTDMSSMFSFNNSFNQDISSWDVSNVTDMNTMFRSANSFNQPIDGWNVSSLTDMSNMFNGSDFNQPLNSWNVSSVTNLNGIFVNNGVFNQPIGNWDVSSVLDMGSMFVDAIAFNQDLSSWDVSNVTDMGGMFDFATSFNQNLGSWDVSNVTNMSSMLSDANLSVTNYDATLIGWNSLPSLQNGVSLGANGINYCSSSLQRANLISTYGWTINDDGQLCAPPTIQADGLTFTGFTPNQVDITWSVGNGFNRIVVMKEMTAVDTDPADNATYVANATFGSGDQLGTGNYVVYNGSGNTVTVSGLTVGSTYHVRIYEYNGSSGVEKYLLTTGVSNPASFTLGPEITTYIGIDNTGTQIFDGQVPSIDFGSSVLGSNIDLTFAIENIGNTNLNITGITSDGTKFFEFGSVTTPILPGATQTFVIRLDGSVDGTFSENITITNDDSDETLFNFPVTGIITTEPEIRVVYDPAGANILLADGQASDVDFGSEVVGNEILKTFEVENIGSAVLTISGITVTGTDFSVLSIPVSVAAGGTETFTIQLSGATIGTFNDIVSIQSDDTDEAVFDFPVTGIITVAAEPEINLFVGPDNTGTTIANGQATIIDVGTAELGTDIDQVFTIENTGAADLNVSSITSSTTAFSLQTLLPAPIPPGATDNFTIQLSGAIEGIFNATITINSDDSDEALFDFPVSGTIQGPEIAVFAGVDNSGISITSGQATPIDFGTELVGADLDQVFAIENQGGSDLVISSISLGSIDFSVITVLPFTVSAGLTSNFTIRLSGQNEGSFSDNVVITSNDTDEPTFGFPISGIIETPDIIIYEGPDTSSPVVVNGQPDSVDVGQTPQGRDVAKEFAVENVGSSDLNILSITTDQPAVFSIENPPTIIAPGTSAVFTIRLNASVPGVYGGNVTISSDAGDITFPVTGEVLLLAEDPPINVFNAVTPNGDGRHDFLRIENIEAYPGNELIIYTKLGEKVFEVKDYNNSDSEIRFEGYSNLKGTNLLPEGTYYYVINYTTSGNESKSLSGFILLGL